MPDTKKPETTQWKFIDYFLTIAIGLMPYFAILLFFIKRPKAHKIHMIVIGMIGFTILYLVLYGC